LVGVEKRAPARPARAFRWPAACAAGFPGDSPLGRPGSGFLRFAGGCDW